MKASLVPAHETPREARRGEPPAWWASLAVLLLAGCGRLSDIPFTPAQTPETWLQIQPYARLQLGSAEMIVVQPSTSVIVFLLGLVALGAGIHFLRRNSGQRARSWWGTALALWGLGAITAGISYEAFSYQIKCAGREVCAWTSGWEIAYLLLSAASVNAMLVAQAYSCTAGRLRRALLGYAIANLGLYASLVTAGVLAPGRFLISFELLLAVCAPTIVFFLALNGRRLAHGRGPMDRALVTAWAWLALTIGAYFVYYLAGWTQALWARGVWFSENDVLHIGLIGWMVFLARTVVPQVTDLPEPATAAARP